MVALEGSGLYRLHWVSGSGFRSSGFKAFGAQEAVYAL